MSSRACGALLAMLLGVTACNPGLAGSMAPSESALVPASLSSVVVAFFPTPSANWLARAEGQLSIDGNCLVLRAGGVTRDLAWPAPDAEWDAESGTISMGGISAQVGDHIVVGGGEGDFTQRDDWIQAPLPECQRVSMWFVHGPIEVRR